MTRSAFMIHLDTIERFRSTSGDIFYDAVSDVAQMVHGDDDQYDLEKAAGDFHERVTEAVSDGFELERSGKLYGPASAADIPEDLSPTRCQLVMRDIREAMKAIDPQDILELYPADRNR